MTRRSTPKNRIYIGAGAVTAAAALLFSTVSANASPATAAAATPPASGTMVVLTPSRIADSRWENSLGTFQRSWKEDLQVAGRGGVPLTGVAAVILNITAVDPSSSGYLTVWQWGIPRPATSSLNFTETQNVANTVIVQLSPDGTVSIFNGSPGNLEVLVDVEGYIPR